MKKLIILFLALFPLVVAGRGQAQARPAVDLFTLEEQLLRNNPLIKDKELEIKTLEYSLRNFTHENKGTFSFTGAYYPDSDYAENVIGYKYGISGAFKYPILGERKDIIFKKGNLRALINFRKAELEELKNKLLYDLRREYVNYYYSYLLEDQIDRYLRELEDLERKVRMRRASKLALNVDVLSVDALIARLQSQKAAIISNKLKSLAAIKTLIGDPYLKEFVPSSKFSGNIENIYFPSSMELFKFAEENRKDIEYLRKAYAELYNAAKDSEKAYPKGWVSLTGALTSYDLDKFDSGVGLLFTFTLPRDRELAQRTLAKEREFRALRQKNRIDLAKTYLLTDLQTALSNFNTFREKYLALKKEYEALSVEMETLKKRGEAGLIVGTDLLSKEALLLNRSVSTYLVMMDTYKNMLTNYFLLLKALGVREIPWLLRFRTAQAYGPSRVPLETPLLYAYVWNSRFLGDREAEDRFLRELSLMGIKGIYLSFDGRQIERFFGSEEGMKELQSFMQRLRAGGVTAQVLLGENTWIYPENRKKLLRIVNLVEKYNLTYPFARFEGIHLDVEPHSLPEWEREKERLAAYYIQTLKDVKFVSNDRVFADVSYKYAKERIGSRNLAEEVLQAVDGVSVMAYTTDLLKLREIAADYRALAQIYGKDLTIALSVEKSQPSSISFFYRPWGEFQKALELLREVGIDKVALQDYSGYREYWSNAGGIPEARPQSKTEGLKPPVVRRVKLIFKGKLPKMVIIRRTS